MAEVAVTVVFAPGPDECLEWPVQLAAGSDVAAALQACQDGWKPHWPSLAGFDTGIWGRKVSRSEPLQDGDRVEIYRPLTVDPKVARRERFRRQGARTSGLFARKRPGGKAGY